MPNPFANHVEGRNVASSLRLLVGRGGRIPTPPDGLSVPEALYRMLAKRKEPVRDDFWTEKAWRAAHEAWRKRWGMPREGEEEDGVQAAHCNQYGHVPGCGKAEGGRNREYKSPGVKKQVHKVNQNQPLHKQIADLAAAIKRASRDGVRLEAVISRPEFGELTLNCGHPGKKNDPVSSGGQGVKHALEARHNVSAEELAETLLEGEVIEHEKNSRLYVRKGDIEIILEKEMQQGSGRVSKAKAKIQTAMHRKIKE